jgi:hypothetical protein
MLHDMWATLIVTLPSQPNAVRVRVWRALKSLGCAALRDGAYLLPAAQAPLFEPLAQKVRAHGGTAMVLAMAPLSDPQRDELLALFDRSEAFASWRESATVLQADLPVLTETEARRRLRVVVEGLHALTLIDHYPGAAAAQAQTALQALRQALDAHFSKGEPRAEAEHGITPLQVARFQGKTWATRARPWVDRLACAWLVRRFIDPRARFVWLADETGPGSPLKTPRGAIGFDFDGARFTHVGALVTFEVMLLSFALHTDLKLQRLAAAVHYLDAGGMPVAEAAGLELVLAGVREMHKKDDALLAATLTVFDAIYAAPPAPATASR